jgi:hypothetical protein
MARQDNQVYTTSITISKHRVRRTYSCRYVVPRDVPGDDEVPSPAIDVPAAEHPGGLAAPRQRAGLDVEEGDPLPVVEGVRDRRAVDGAHPVLAVVHQAQAGPGGVVDEHHGAHAVAELLLEFPCRILGLQVLVFRVDQPHRLPCAVHLRDLTSLVLGHVLEGFWRDHRPERTHAGYSTLLVAPLRPILPDRSLDLLLRSLAPFVYI